MKFSVRALLVLTTVVAIVTAAITALGLEVGIVALFLGTANASILTRLFLSKKKLDETEVGWLTFAWIVVGSLTIAMLHDLFFGVVTL